MTTPVANMTATQQSKQKIPNSREDLKDAPNKPFKYFTCESESIVVGKRIWWTFGLRRYATKKVYSCTNDETDKRVTFYQKLTRKMGS